MTLDATTARVLRSDVGEIIGAIEAVRDRFMIDATDVDGRFSILQHLFPPRALAAPLHMHTREDEWSFVLEGRIGAVLGETEVVGEVGDLIWKPRNQWHTFWNAGDTPARVLEIISPGGFEESFREMHNAGGELTPDGMTDIAGRYGVTGDFERTQPIIDRHRLVF
jgi:mannose-6-phosphate isomerase-like protein (cupin superfamily)